MACPVFDSLNIASPGVISLIGAGGKTSLMFCLARELAGAGWSVLTTTTTNVYFPSKEQSAVTLVAETAPALAARSALFLQDHRHLSAGSCHVPDAGKLKGFSASVIDEIWHAGCFDWIIVEADGARQLPVKASAAHEPVMPSTTTAIVHVTGLDALNMPVDETHVHRPAIFRANTGLAPGSRVDMNAMAVSCVLEIWKARAMAGSDPAAVVWLNKADDHSRVAAGRAVAGLLQKKQTLFQQPQSQKGMHAHPCHRVQPFFWPGRVVIASLADADPVREVVIL